MVAQKGYDASAKTRVRFAAPRDCLMQVANSPASATCTAPA